MKLLSLKLCNFRQFYGKTPTINLASGRFNTTIIHGNNGAGKTTILNAFTWVLYEQFSAAFAAPETLVNKRAIHETNIGSVTECWVQLEFERDRKRYQLKRKCYAHKNSSELIEQSQSQLYLLIAGDDGRWYHPTEQPEDIIGRILPESLHRYFFFDGEHIDRIFRHGNNNRIAEDTKELLGVKVLDRAIEHLKKARKSLQEELKQIGNLQTKKLLQQLKQLEEKRDRSEQIQIEISDRLEEYEREKKEISRHLLELSGAEELQQLKVKLETEIQRDRQQLITAKDCIKQRISRQGFLVFLDDLTAKFQALVDELRVKGEIPSGIKKQFVRDLLNEQTCICGTELLTGTEAYERVKAWMNKAGVADVEESAIRLEDRVKKVAEQSGELWSEIDERQDIILQTSTKIAQIENQIDTLTEKLRTYPDTNIQQLQKKLDTLEESLKELFLDRGANQQQLEQLRDEINFLEQQINKQKIKEEKQLLTKKRLQATQTAIETLIEVRDRLEQQFRLSLEQKVRAIFQSISFTPYMPKIGRDYQLKLVEDTSGMLLPVAASTGENQILSLSFIGAIVDRVREWSRQNTLVGIDSSTFPIVMDSPFGSLDEIYRRQVAKSMPLLANQLVILATNTQWREEVETEINNYLGKEYVLVYYSPKSDCQTDAIAINGRVYPLVKSSPNQFEYTEIIEVD